MLNKNLQEPLKFLAVGLINTVVGAAAMFVLYNIFHAGYWVSSAANYILGSVCSFFLNKYFTFGSKRLCAQEAVLFVLCIAACYAFSYGLARPFVRILLSPYSKRLHDNAAMIFGSVVFTAANFICQKYIVFRKRR